MARRLHGVAKETQKGIITHIIRRPEPPEAVHRHYGSLLLGLSGGEKTEGEAGEEKRGEERRGEERRGEERMGGRRCMSETVTDYSE